MTQRDTVTQADKGRADADWVARAASDVIAEAQRRSPGATIVCASGISPSGPIHLGSLREIMTPHLVADEIRRRGVPCEHILSWDDFDRLRKVPAGVSAEFAEHIGRPLTGVPDPQGELPNWAERFKGPFRAAMRELGIEIREISQTQMYRSGVYADHIITALEHRKRIAEVLAEYRTAGAEAGEGTGDDYYPYRPYCHVCGRDTTTVLGFDAAAARVDYRCACGHTGADHLRDRPNGKLVWKVDWPMRWAFERVLFEPAGADHASPGSSFTVGTRLVREVYGTEPPVYFGYSFVGIRGMAKLSGSVGQAPLPADALRVLEAPVLRWLFIRRRPSQAITVELGEGTPRLYDEWDALGERCRLGTVDAWEAETHRRATTTSLGRLRQPARPVPFRFLTSIVDVTAGDDAQIARILSTLHGGEALTLDDVAPRLDLARAWIEAYLPAQERTRVRDEPAAQLAALPDVDAEALAILLDRLDAHWNLADLTRLVYGVAKVQLGLDLDAEPTAEVKRRQKEFFGLLYRLLVDAERGPRLPTLMLAIGKDRLRHLLTPPAE